MADSTHKPAEPRLGAALVFGGDAAICVHVHTDPAGAAQIWDRLNAVEIDPASGDEYVHTVAVIGSAIGAAESESWTFTIPAADMEDVIALAKGLNR